MAWSEISSLASRSDDFQVARAILEEASSIFHFNFTKICRDLAIFDGMQCFSSQEWGFEMQCANEWWYTESPVRAHSMPSIFGVVQDMVASSIGQGWLVELVMLSTNDTSTLFDSSTSMGCMYAFKDAFTLEGDYNSTCAWAKELSMVRIMNGHPVFIFLIKLCTFISYLLGEMVHMFLELVHHMHSLYLEWGSVFGSFDEIMDAMSQWFGLLIWFLAMFCMVHENPQLVIVAYLCAMLPSVDAAPCPHCHGNAPSCTYGTNNKCPLITIVAQNAAFVVGATTVALTLANLIRPRFLRAFPSSALELVDRSTSS